MNFKHWGRVAGMLGLVVLFSAVFNWLFVYQSVAVTPVAVRFALSFAGIAFWLFATRGEKRMGRGAFYGTMSAVSFAVLLGALVGVNYIAVKKPRSWDATREQLFTLSDQTAKTLKDLTGKVEVTAFYSPDEPAFFEANARLDQYARQTDKLSVEFVDPYKHPEKVQEKNLTQNGPRIFFKSGSKESRAKDISEQGLTNALIDATSATAKTKKVYFVRGHGERQINDSAERGFRLFNEQLKSEGYQTDEIVLAEHKKMPDDTQLMVIGAPAASLQEGELKLVKEYVENDGKLLVMIDPRTEGGLAGLLQGFGIHVDNDIIVDPESQSPQMAIAVQYVTHPIVTPRGGGNATMTVFPVARSIRKADDVPAGWQVTEIAKTGNKAWGETDLSTLNTGRSEFNEGQDIKGPVPIVTVAVRGGENTSQSRVVAIGNSLFAANTYLNIAGNRDLALNAVAWAAQDESRMYIRPKQRLSNHLFLTLEQKQKMTLFAFDLLPFGLLFAGLLVWQTRKSR
jgi:ABC-type uncharacterized transport system involved in gliding motility auxiliary subunit